MSPQELYDDHRQKPRNIGKLLNANATGDVGSIVVGDALRFYLKVDNERITAAKFQVFNGADQIAAASITTELVVGKTLDEAWELSPLAVAQHLGLDPYRLPARLWAIEGLRSAIAVYRGEEREADVEQDPLVCRCHGIAEDTIRQAVTVSGLETVDDVVNATGAGTGCGSCRVDLPRLIDEAKGKAAATSAEPATPAPRRAKGRIAVIHQINRLVDDQIRPGLRAQAMDLELVDLDGATVVVRLSGTADAPARANALAGVERLLKDKVDAGLGVRAE